MKYWPGVKYIDNSDEPKRLVTVHPDEAPSLGEVNIWVRYVDNEEWAICKKSNIEPFKPAIVKDVLDNL